MTENGKMAPDLAAYGPQFSVRLAYGKVPRPPYAYGMFQAARLAERLGLPRISAIEFGVAGGSGLVAMEKIAREVEKELPIEFEIYGFDTGSGLPEPIGYQDLPYLFGRGEYKMDEAKLRRRLARAHLVLGDVANTVPTFFENYAPAPIGFVSIDLDLYSSTISALTLFDTDHQNVLPRVYCYFDDIIGDDFSTHNEWVGELLAIREFNEKNKLRKITPIYGLSHQRNREKQCIERGVAVRVGIQMLIPPGHRFILVGKEDLGVEIIGDGDDRRALPFLERDGCDWGPPPDDATAISELERMREAGADFIAFAWHALWWLDYYAGFRRYLRSNFPCVVDTAHLVVFDLRPRGWAMFARACRVVFRLVPERDQSAKYRKASLALTAEREEPWNDQIFVHHAFDHPLYNRKLYSEANKQLPLEETSVCGI